MSPGLYLSGPARPTRRAKHNAWLVASTSYSGDLLFGAAFRASEEPPNLGVFDFICGCLLLVYYTVCYVPPPGFALNH
jgi:hypothetical protein